MCLLNECRRTWAWVSVCLLWRIGVVEMAGLTFGTRAFQEVSLKISRRSRCILSSTWSTVAGFGAFFQLAYDYGLSAGIECFISATTHCSAVVFLCAVNRIKYKSNVLSAVFFCMWARQSGLLSKRYWVAYAWVRVKYWDYCIFYFFSFYIFFFYSSAV